MSKRTFSLEKFLETPVIGILRGYPMEIIHNLIPVYLKSGFYTLEVTMNSKSAPQTISSVTKNFPELNIGAGTVCTMDDLKMALEAGSQFIVTPILNEEVINFCVNRKIPVFPGAFTPTEIYKAWSLGASAVKVFPASQLGVTYIKEVLAPLNDIRLLPTGGVSVDNIHSYFKAGAVGVGMGGSLFDKEMVNQENWQGLNGHLEELKRNIPATNEFNSLRLTQ